MFIEIKIVIIVLYFFKSIKEIVDYNKILIK